MTVSHTRIRDLNVYVAFYLEEWAFGNTPELDREGNETLSIDLWRETAAWFGASGLLVIREKGGLPLNAHDKMDVLPALKISEFETMEEARYTFDHCEWTYFDPRGGTSLEEYKHPPRNCVYAFGRDSSGFKPNLIHGIRIPAVRNVGSLWSVSAATVVLYDRMLKLKTGLA